MNDLWEQYCNPPAEPDRSGLWTHSTAGFEHPRPEWPHCILDQSEPCESCGTRGRVWPDDPDSDSPPTGWCHVVHHDHPDRWRCTIQWSPHTVGVCRIARDVQDAMRNQRLDEVAAKRAQRQGVPGQRTGEGS